MREITEVAELDSKKDRTRSRLGGKLRGALLAAVILIAGIAAVIPFFFSSSARTPDNTWGLRVIDSHDIYNHAVTMKEFDRVLRSGVWYPRWMANFNSGYGTALMLYYPPGFYYLTSLFYATSDNWMAAIFLVCALFMVTSGFALYLLAREFFGRFASVMAALLYILLPYHTLDLYWRAALAEFLGFTFMPLIIYFAYKVGSEGRLRYYAGLGLFYGLYLLTHLPVSYIFTYTLAFYAVVWAYRRKNLKIALRIAGGMSIGLLVGAIYWLPAALEAKYAMEWVTVVFPYDRTYMTLLPGANYFDDLITKTFAYQTATIIVAALILRALPATNARVRTDSAELNKPLWITGRANPLSEHLAPIEFQPRLWIVMAAAATFMSTSFSIYVSHMIPKIEVAGPAWRWLAIASVFLSLLVGATIDRLTQRIALSPVRLWAYRAAISAAVIVNVSLSIWYVIIPALSNPNFTFPEQLDTVSFIPKTAKAIDAQMVQSPQVVIEPEGGETEMVGWEPQHRELYVKVSQPSTVRLRTYYFPGWTARIDGQPAQVSFDESGVQVIAVPPGVHKIESSFVNTPPRSIGTFLHGLGLLTIAGLFVTDYARRSRLTRRKEVGAFARGGGSAAMSEPSVVREGFDLDSIKPASELSGAGVFSQRRKKLLIIGGAALFATVVVVAIARRPDATGGSRPATNPSATPRANDGGVAGRGPVTTGSDARLYIEGMDSIYVAADEKALNELMTALSKKDGPQIDDLVESDRVFKVVRDTKVRVLEMGAGKIRVRVSEGDRVMSEGWVLDRWVR